MEAVCVSLVWVALIAWGLDRVLKHRAQAVPPAVDLKPLHDVIDDTVHRLHNVESVVDRLHNQMRDVTTLAEDTKSLAAEAKKMNSQTNLAMGFKNLAKRE